MLGTLPNYPIVRQMYHIFLTQKTGRIDFIFSGENCHVWIENGNPVAAELYAQNINPLQIAVELSLLKQHEASSVSIDSNETILSLKDKLIQSKLMSEVSFDTLLKEKMKREFAVLCLSKENAEFKSDAGCPDTYIPCPINFLGTLFFIFQFYSTPDQIQAMENHYQGSVISPKANFSQVSNVMEFPPSIVDSLSTWTQPRSLSDLYMISGLSQREVVALVAILQLVNALEIRKNGQEEKKVVVNNAATTRVPPKVQPSQAKTKIEPKPVNNDRKKRDELLVAEAKKCIVALNTHNPLEILGVTPNSETCEIKKAYNLLARKFHPDRISGSSIEHLKKDFEKLFAEIGNAYHTLVDQELREEFLECLKDPVIQGNLQKLDQRKRAIYEKQKTAILFKKRDFSQTIVNARRALAIFAFDPEILIMLGWSVFSTAEDKQKGFKDSEKYFERALKILPSFSDGHYYKALVFKALGDFIKAKDELCLAVKYDQNNKEAAQELRGLE